LRRGFGMRLDLARVPLRETGLRPWEVWVSESQERMVFEVRPRHRDALLALFRRFDVPATPLGEVVAGADETIVWDGDPVAHLRLGFRVDPAPLHRPTRSRRPAAGAAPPVPSDDLGALVEDLVLAPDRSRASR
ncbi:protein containing AIR synthase related protein, partial [mine drainage metagenome]